MTSIPAPRMEFLVRDRTGKPTQQLEANCADLDLVEAAKAGDRTAFGRLYAAYARMVHGILLNCVPANAVEDLVQDVFLQAMPKLASLRDASRFGGWLAAIARNRAMDFHRRSRANEEFDDERHFVASAATGASAGSDRSEAAIVLQAIRDLPEAYRETLILRLVEGMTGPEIAAKTLLTPGSVRVNLHRGMQQLRERLGRTDGTGQSEKTK